MNSQAVCITEESILGTPGEESQLWTFKLFVSQKSRF